MVFGKGKNNKIDIHHNNCDYPCSKKTTLAASEAIQKITKNCRVVDETKFDKLPQYHPKELDLGKLLGRGGFNNVYEILSINSNDTDSLSPRSSSDGYSTMSEDDDDDKNDAVTSQYSFKCLRHGFMFDRFKSKRASADLAVEAHILCSINHPNIIKLHGISCGGISAIESSDKLGFFLILDRLDETLAQRHKRWMSDERRLKKKKILLDDKETAKHQEDMFAGRLKIMLDIASAMLYLHKNNIIYRDLKLENIGFDMKGNVKLFDFGLSRELSSYDKLDDGTYNMSGCGSRRYMAPEVALRQPYNLLADVYSFGIMLWEMCAVKRAFEEYNNNELHHRLVVKMGERPWLDDAWPLTIRRLMRCCWSGDVNERLGFESIVKIMGDQMSNDSDVSILKQ